MSCKLVLSLRSQFFHRASCASVQRARSRWDRDSCRQLQLLHCLLLLELPSENLTHYNKTARFLHAHPLHLILLGISNKGHFYWVKGTLLFWCRSSGG